MSVDFLYWRESLWLLVILIPLFTVLLSKYYQNRKWKQIADPHLLPWVQTNSLLQQHKLRIVCLALAWIFFSIALAGPRTPQWIPPSLLADKTKLIVIVDFSSSMRAQNQRRSRIEKSQALLKSWLKNIPENLTLGLVIYAGHAHNYLPPTSDKKILNHYIKQLSLLKPPTLGNNLAAAIKKSGTWLNINQKQQHLILFSDGDIDNNSRSQAEAAISTLQKKQNVQMSIIGLGFSEAVVVPRSATEALIINGKPIVSHRHSSWLQQFAKFSDGKYHAAEDIQQHNLEKLLELPKAQLDPKNTNQVIWDEWFFIPLLCGIFLILITIQQTAPIKLHLVNALLLSSLASCYLPNKNISYINHLISKQEYAQVQKLTETMDGYHARFAEGIACYRQNNYNCALQAFSRASWLASGKHQRGRAVFNLANTHFKLGDYEQASVLFKDAEQLGVASSKTQLNQEFADSLADSIRRQFADIKRTEERIKWMQSVQIHSKMQDLDDRIAEGINFSRPKKQATDLLSFSSNEQNRLISRGLHRLQNSEHSIKSAQKKLWFESSEKTRAESTAELFNRLMPMEIGIPYLPDEPLQIAGQRVW
jgi:Ca-activated chloride channel homolog